MLKGIHPLLSPDLLHALAGMGHGDEIGIVDANFPAASLGPRLIELRGASSPDALDAVLTLFPLDTRVVPAVHTMEVVGDPAAVPEPVMDFAAVFTRHGLADCEIGALERHAFYDRARRAFALVRTGELRPYGNILLVKGVVNRYEPIRRTDPRACVAMIVVFGSINLDLVARVVRLPQPGETIAGDSFATLPGGKGANQALAARRAGAEVALAGAVGNDPFAGDALSGLSAAGVDLAWVVRAARAHGRRADPCRCFRPERDHDHSRRERRGAGRDGPRCGARSGKYAASAARDPHRCRLRRGRTGEARRCAGHPECRADGRAARRAPERGRRADRQLDRGGRTRGRSGNPAHAGRIRGSRASSAVVRAPS